MKRLLALAVLLSVMSVPALAIPILSPGDFIIAVDADGMVSRSSYPPGEAPEYALDGDVETKYLNFAGAGSGFIVTPIAPAPVLSFTLTTANDAPGRDPISWELYGTNDAISSADNSTGLMENWTLIDAGAVTLPDDRKTLGPVVTVNNTAAYGSFRMVYPELKGDPLMQVADVAFYPTPGGMGPNLLSLASIIAIHAAPDSYYPANESPDKLLDGDPETKYLNFGKQNSGFIVTPSIGPSTLEAFQITTANDHPQRDPVVWMLYGTNDEITTPDNGDGTAEDWTLICAGTLALPEERLTPGNMVQIANQSEDYASYMMLFPTVKDATDDSVQLSEIQFYGVPEPATVCLLGFGALALIRKRRV